MYTPWGASQTVEKIADGIEFVSTSSHGGIRLSAENQKIVKDKFPTFESFVGGWEWYEEDCDVAVVVAAFPQHFPPLSVEKAKQLIISDKGYFKIDKV